LIGTHTKESSIYYTDANPSAGEELCVWLL